MCHFAAVRGCRAASAHKYHHLPVVLKDWDNFESKARPHVGDFLYEVSINAVFPCPFGIFVYIYIAL